MGTKIVKAQGECSNVPANMDQKCCPAWENALTSLEGMVDECNGEEKDGTEALINGLQRTCNSLCKKQTLLVTHVAASKDSKCMEDVTKIVKAQGECSSFPANTEQKCCPLWENAVTSLKGMVDECNGEEKDGTEAMINGLQRTSDLLCKKPTVV